MTIFQILSYINKISLILFFIILIFLGYQFYLLKKEISSTIKEKPIIPDFNDNIQANINYTPLKQEENINKIIFKKKSSIFIYGGILAIITFFIFLILSFRITKQPSINYSQINNNIITPTIKEFFINKISPTLEPSENIILTPTNTVLITPTNEPIVISSIITPTITPTEKQISPTTQPTTITQLPISGFFDKSLFFMSSAFFLIVFSLVF